MKRNKMAVIDGEKSKERDKTMNNKWPFWKNEKRKLQ